MTGWVFLLQKRFSKHNLIGFISLVLACLINPWGWNIFPYALKTRTYSSFLQISEWTPITSTEKPTQFIAFWFLLIGLIFWLSRNLSKKISVSFLKSPFIPLVLISFIGLRLSVFAYFVLPVFLLNHASFFNKMKQSDKSQNLTPNILFLIFILALNIFSLPYFKLKYPDYFPARFKSIYDSNAVFKISEKINSYKKDNCPILNEFDVGGYLMMAVKNPLLIDGRITPFTQEAFETYFNFIRSNKVEELVNHSSACFAVISNIEHSELIKYLKTKMNFQEVMKENDYTLLVRDL